ncbi:hypothetical protein CDAR_124611 [Caerostris darwini]|uniref:Uncharacterized protein n=1 Tax=Caerostris darwini TaxID=1538125 RepID=A0AAV4RLC7_9ARAC|nr:hypothetical protein CDAR_124611 [Caerostris darwini]
MRGCTKVPCSGDYNGEIMSGKPLDGGGGRDAHALPRILPPFSPSVSFAKTNMDDICPLPFRVRVTSAGNSRRFLGKQKFSWVRNFRSGIGKG